MNITEVRVRLIKKDEGKLKAVASVTIDDCFVVHDVKIIEGSEGCFILSTPRPGKCSANAFSPSTRRSRPKRPVDRTQEKERKGLFFSPLPFFFFLSRKNNNMRGDSLCS